MTRGYLHPIRGRRTSPRARARSLESKGCSPLFSSLFKVTPRSTEVGRSEASSSLSVNCIPELFNYAHPSTIPFPILLYPSQRSSSILIRPQFLLPSFPALRSAFQLFSSFFFDYSHPPTITSPFFPFPLFVNCCFKYKVICEQLVLVLVSYSAAMLLRLRNGENSGGE